MTGSCPKSNCVWGKDGYCFRSPCIHQGYKPKAEPKIEQIKKEVFAKYVAEDDRGNRFEYPDIESAARAVGRAVSTVAYNLGKGIKVGGYYWSLEYGDKISLKRRIVAVKDRKERTFDGLREAVEKTGLYRSELKKALDTNGEYGGYKWGWLDVVRAKPIKTDIISIDAFGKETEFASIRKAAEFYNIAHQRICIAIKNGGQVAGLRWKRKV